MNEMARLEELRQLFRNAPESEASRIVAFFASLALAALVLYLVRRRALREEYTPIWMAVSGVLLLMSWKIEILHTVTRVIGAWTTSSTIFFLGMWFLVVICLNFAVRLSRASVLLKTLGQEVALLRAQLEEFAGDRTRRPGT